MGFSGGGGGSTGVTNHVHTNALGEGGALNDTSLINTRTLKNEMIFQSMVYG